VEPVAAALDDQVLIRGGTRSHQSRHHLTIPVGLSALTRQSGFTLIELITTVVLLGILSVTELGRYQDRSIAAENARVDAILQWSAITLIYDYLIYPESGHVTR
jgi:prepilin-type N-terminal cleavage/methylation domain-containing protein